MQHYLNPILKTEPDVKIKQPRTTTPLEKAIVNHSFRSTNTQNEHLKDIRLSIAEVQSKSAEQLRDAFEKI